MRPGSMLIALAIVGCSSGRGVDVDITAPSGATSIELLVAPGQCEGSDGSACAPGIAWGSAGPQASGTIYSVDSESRNVLPMPASGTVRFRLEAGDSDQVDRLAAVAFDANNAAIAIKVLDDVTVPKDHAEIWKVALDPITDIPAMPDAAPTGATDLAHVWRAPVMAGGPEDASQYPSCVARQKWSNDNQTWDREFLVPGDHDCDNEAIECNPFYYDFNASAMPTTCATNTSGQFSPSCLLGQSLCADGKSAATACTPPPNHPILCVPDAICGCTDPGTFGACAGQKMVAAMATPLQTMLTIADCGHFPVDPAATGGPCTSNSANSIIAGTFPPGCASATLYQFALPGLTALGTAPATFKIGTASFAMSMAADTTACVVSLSWESGTRNTGPTPLLLDVSYNTVHLLLPVKIAFETPQTCPPSTQLVSCPLGGTGSADTMYQCAR